MLRKRELAVCDQIIGSLNRSRVKWRLATQQSIDDTSNGPNLGGDAVSFLSNYLWRDIVGCSAKAWLVLGETCGETKVSNLNLHVFGEKHVAKLQISVQDSLGVDVPGSGGNLAEIVPDFRFCQVSSVLGYVEKRSLGSKF